MALEVEGAVGQEESVERAALRKAFGALMSSPPDSILSRADAMVARLESKLPHTRSPTEALILRIHTQFPRDIGLFNIMFLNHCVLRPGQVCIACTYLSLNPYILTCLHYR